MKVSGTYTLDATREQVWDALNNVDVLARVVPGCERLDQLSPTEFEGLVKIGIQSIRGSYSGKIRLEDVQHPSHYKLIAHGSSANAVVDGSGTVDLAEVDGGRTLLTYAGDAQIGGMLASVGQRLIEGAARQLINQSLKALDAQVALRVAAPVPAAPVAPQHAAGDVAGDVAGAAAVTDLVEPLPPAETMRRSVIVPPDEQLQPGDVVGGIIKDFVAQQPWVIALIAFVLGVLVGRGTRK